MLDTVETVEKDSRNRGNIRGSVESGNCEDRGNSRDSGDSGFTGESLDEEDCGDIGESRIRLSRNMSMTLFVYEIFSYFNLQCFAQHTDAHKHQLDLKNVHFKNVNSTHSFRNVDTLLIFGPF